jgi:hypothetical protein
MKTVQGRAMKRRMFIAGVGAAAAAGYFPLVGTGVVQRLLRLPD